MKKMIAMIKLLYICSEDGIDVTLGTNADLWVANVYLKQFCNKIVTIL